MNENALFIAEDDQNLEIQPIEDEISTEKYLIFITSDLKFGVNAEYVVEIITNHSITQLPMVPSFIRGIINLRGQILPVVDIRLRLGMEVQEECLVIVLSIDGTYIGILVDSVDQMVDIPTESILPPPIHNEQKMASGMCSLPDGSGTMMVLDCNQLLLHE
ncbi:MAG: chemotaxis protein CheW [Oscillospiraceae bacterium]|nr:chemotaxis protein CheW [Oscillospiraceae bacterium]